MSIFVVGGDMQIWHLVYKVIGSNRRVEIFNI